MTKIYHNPRCSKSRQTLSLLQDQGIEATIIEYLKNPLTKAEIKKILSMLGIEARELLRKKEVEFKEMGLDKPGTNENNIIQAMVSHPKLIERPIVIHGDKAAIGRPPEAILEIL